MSVTVRLIVEAEIATNDRLEYLLHQLAGNITRYQRIEDLSLDYVIFRLTKCLSISLNKLQLHFRLSSIPTGEI
jgi:hypothetical protein